MDNTSLGSRSALERTFGQLVRVLICIPASALVALLAGMTLDDAGFDPGPVSYLIAFVVSLFVVAGVLLPRAPFNAWWVAAGLVQYAIVVAVTALPQPEDAAFTFDNLDDGEPRLAWLSSLFGQSASSIRRPLHTGLFWNTWFDGEDKPESSILSVGKDYTFNLDLSAFDYSALRPNDHGFRMSTSADRPVGILVSGEAKSARLRIIPIVPEGSGLAIQGAQPPPIDLNLNKIRSPNLKAAMAYMFAPKPRAVPEELRAGRTSFVIRTRQKGCPRITFAIFEDLRPLDHLVQRMVVKDEDGNLPPCANDVDAQTSKLSGGLDALRDASLGADTTKGAVVGSAALYIFDADTANSVAVFVDGRKGVERSIYGWQTDRSVVDYLRHNNFEQRIAQARVAASKGRAGPYVEAARDLWTELFTANDGTEAEAQKAAAALKELVSASSSPPVIVVRIASSLADGKTRSLFAPFGILGAKGPGAVLDKPIIVVQPMAVERAVDKGRCIRSWTLALPEKIDGDVDLSSIPDPLPGKRLPDMEQFAAFMDGGNASDQDASQASGLLVLAHQSDGELWFRQAEAHVSRIGRTFSRGSAGILSACSVAAATNRNSQLLESLNRQGLDTVIASPFALDPTYGVRFAYSFAEAIGEATAKTEQPTMLELFNRAVSKTVDKFAKVKAGNYEELGLEYVLLGNPSIRLCKQAP